MTTPARKEGTDLRQEAVELTDAPAMEAIFDRLAACHRSCA